MKTATISPQFQIVIPEDICVRHHLKPGQEIQFAEKDGDIVLRPILTGKDLIGYLKEKKRLEFERDIDRELLKERI